MNKKNTFITSLIIFVILAGTAFSVSASVIPTLSLSYYPNNNSVQVTVYADPNAAVQLYSSSFIGIVGYTNANGYFSSMVSGYSYNIPSNSSVYVIVDGAVSQQMQWPYYNNNYNVNNNYNNYNYSPVSFSQNNINVEIGQSTNVALYGGYNNNYYLASNSSLVGTGIAGNTLSVYGNSNGTANLTICSYSGGACGTLFVTVYGNPAYYPTYYYPQYNYQYPNQYQYSNYYYNYQYPISLSQNSISMNVGQNQSVNISGGGGYYYLSNISTPSIVSASVNGSNLNIYANSPGSTNVTVCQNNGSCAYLYVNVLNNYNFHPYHNQPNYHPNYGPPAPYYRNNGMY